MKIDIIKPDGTVSKDGVSISGLSLSNTIFNDVWAVHWDSSTSKGYVEKTDLSVEDITDFTPYESAITEYDATYVSIPEITAEEKVRAERDIRLQATDWMALTDVTMSDEWKTYRQALRDLPANTSDFTNPTYPTEPT
tara:strand:+ start:140 stop:553 length:414 start_codon:yes stop_codon:yes gene_type:complete